MKDKNIFVTGATGLIGPWLINKLLNLNAKVCALIREPKENYNLLFNDKKVKLYEGDITNFVTLKNIILKEDFDYVFHLASTNINYGKNFSPIETFDTNVKGAFNLLESCRLYGNDYLNIVFTSSREVYNESSINTPQKIGYHPYAVSKMCVD